VSGPPPSQAFYRNLGRFLEIQNLGLNLPFALAFLFVAAGFLPSLRVLLLVVIAFLAARNAGHSFNRYADRFFDAQTARTRARPLVTNRSRTAFALSFATANCVVLVVAAYFLNFLAFVLSPIAVLGIFGYSYSKRYTSLTTIYLGLVEAITPAAVFIAVDGTLPWPAWSVVAAMLSWGTAFEMIHSLRDVQSDRDLGLFSLPARLGPVWTVRLIPPFHAAALGLFLVFGLLEKLRVPFVLGVVAMTAVTIWTDVEVIRNPQETRRPFRRHFLLGLLFLAGTFGAVFGPTVF
jgi:4-hydroxybenzoate polyprenyltransferase